jgi:acetyl esterase/lipase
MTSFTRIPTALALALLVYAPVMAQDRTSAPRPSEQAPGIPEAIQAECDLPYAGTNNPRQRLDLYLPKSPKGKKPLPLVVFIHGGAFIFGDRKPEGGAGDPSGLNLMLAMVASGEYAGASLGYRLSKEAIWPAQIHDCKAAIRWLRGNAKKYGLDPNHIGVMGTSAGGHLAAMIGTSGDVTTLEGNLGSHRDVSSRVTCIVDQYGPIDFLALHGENNRSPDTPAAKLIGGPLPDNLEATHSASPLTYIVANNPPFLIIQGTKDPVVNFTQSESFFSALQKAGVNATFIRVIGGGHGNFPTPEVPQRIRAFFDKHLRGKEMLISAEPISVEGR